MAFDTTKTSSSQALAGTQYSSIKLGTGADDFGLHDPLEPFEKLDSPPSHLIPSRVVPAGHFPPQPLGLPLRGRD